MKLYKFRSPDKLQFTMDILLNQRLHCADWRELNDPMEGIFEYRTRGCPERQRDLEMIRDHKLRYRVCSLSQTWNSSLLWAHYAGGFRGVAIEIEMPDPIVIGDGPIPHSPDLVAEIAYREGFTFADTDGRYQPQTLAQRILTSKHADWAYEQEVRVLSEREYFGIEGKICRIIVGARAEDAVLDTIKQAAVGRRVEIVRLAIDGDGLRLVGIRRGEPR